MAYARNVKFMYKRAEKDAILYEYTMQIVDCASKITAEQMVDKIMVKRGLGMSEYTMKVTPITISPAKKGYRITGEVRHFYSLKRF